jgi:uncharacterized protein (TIGR02996 family)
VLYELEEGTSRKFYRIELHGTRVHLHWGRIGTEGEHQVIACENEAAARAEYQRQLDKRTERGYRKVVDETVPHDPATVEKARLERTGALSRSPRFLFVHRAKRRFAWVEARGAELVSAKGLAADVATTTPKTKTCASEAAAVRERDALIATWMTKGYELDTFGAKEAPKKRMKQTLAFDEDLERAVAEDPYDDAAWAVLEDWVLQQDDPRAEIVRLGKANQRGDEAEARGTALPLLYGSKHEALSHAVVVPVWRAGYLVECQYHQPTRSVEPTFAGFFGSPAARLLRSIDLHLDRLRHLTIVMPVLARSPCARSLRKLVVHPVRVDDLAVVDAAALAALTRLETLAIHPQMAQVQGRATHRSLNSLLVRVDSPAALEGWCAQTLPALRQLHVILVGRPSPKLGAALAPLLAGTMAPALESLAISCHRDAVERIEDLLEASEFCDGLAECNVIS